MTNLETNFLEVSSMVLHRMRLQGRTGHMIKVTYLFLVTFAGVLRKF